MSIVSQALTNGQQLKTQITELQEKLHKALPDYKELLQVIHTNLRKDEDLVHLLSPEDIGVIVAGLSKHKNIVIATATAKGSGGKKSKSITVDDL